MKTAKYIFIHIELIAMILCVILGIGAAESQMWFAAYGFILSPFIYGKLVHFSKHIDFCEAYERAMRIKNFKQIKHV